MRGLQQWIAYEQHLVFGDVHVPSFQFPPGVWVVNSEVTHIYDVPGPESFVLYLVHSKEHLAQSFSSFKWRVRFAFQDAATMKMIVSTLCR